MNILHDDRNLTAGRPYAPGPHRPGPHPAPPPPRPARMTVVFEEEDQALLERVFGDADTALAASEIIFSAPPEIQILAIQLLDLIKEEEKQ